MSESKHTPEPWELQPILSGSENDRGWNIVGTDGRRGRIWIAKVSPVIRGARGEASEEGVANARLMRAAPLLLRAVREYHKANRLHHDEDARLYDLSKAALKALEGK